MANKVSTLSRRKGYPQNRADMPEFWAYRDAKARCSNSKHSNWKNYGGRGILFRFANFKEFYAELGPRPKGLSLDRIDNNGHYEKGNVRWASRSQQTLNRRPNVPSTHCKRGHPLSGSNLGWSKGKGRVSRRCLQCHREYEARRREAQKRKSK